jgi:hypothetical protein
MIQEDKELLLKDLCSRLPYEVILLSSNGKVTYQTDGNTATELLVEEGWKPYLRPLSSMTEEEFGKLEKYSELIYDQLNLASFQDGAYKCLDFYLTEVPSDVVIRVFDWLNKNHFDYRGLIEKGLAIKVTTENNPYKE